MKPEGSTLEEAKQLAKEARAKEPLLAGITERTLIAVAYYIKASSESKPVSKYDVEDMFEVADTAFRRCYGRMATALGIKQSPYVKRRSRNAYDIYAEILRNEGSLLTPLITKIHVRYTELMKHITFLLERGLIKEVDDRGSKRYFPTEKGWTYLEDYDRLRKHFAAKS